jgi:hypothetical protein
MFKGRGKGAKININCSVPMCLCDFETGTS